MSLVEKVLNRCRCIVRRDLEVGNVLSAFYTLKYEFRRVGCFITDESDSIDENTELYFVAECDKETYRVVVDGRERRVKVVGACGVVAIV